MTEIIVTVPKIKTPDLTAYETHLLFHKLWTACVGTKHYDKQAWISIEDQLRDIDMMTESKLCTTQ